MSFSATTPTPTPTATLTPTFTPTPTPIPSGPVTINYVYDPLYRLKEANYSNGDYYRYTYDAVGNRLTQQKSIVSLVTTDTYVYDDANRLSSVNGVNYTWDNNGNLLSDGVNTYTYDAANRLKQLTQGANTHTFSYNGLGDRIAQNGVHYTLDLNAGLTQVLSDGTNIYLYGLDRVAERQGSASEYYLGDALGSVRQIVNPSGAVTLAQSYDPYGNTRQTLGDAQTDFGFTGEFIDPSGLIHLRARYYDSLTGRFTTRDTFAGNANVPASLNRFNYAHSNPVMNTDPSGQCIFAGVDTVLCAALGGGIGGAITGAVIGGAYAKWMYHLAYTGKCGCEGQQIISQYTESQFFWKGVGMGAAFGAVFGALAATGTAGVAITALAGMGFSTYGIATSIQRIQADPHNECAWWDLGLSIFGLVASGYAFGKAVGEIRLPGGGPAPLKYAFSQFSELVSRISKGKPVVVIGEGMSRVNPVAEALRKAGFDVKTYEPRNFRSTPGNLSQLDLEANRSWLRYWTLKKGATVIDIGLQKGRPEPSPFYALEWRSIYQNWKYPNVLRFIVP